MIEPGLNFFNKNLKNTLAGNNSYYRLRSFREYTYPILPFRRNRETIPAVEYIHSIYHRSFPRFF